MIDKRQLAVAFRDQLQELMGRNGLTQARLAQSAGFDRSGLAQLLSGSTPRLPRAETLAAIATTQGVSVDWLLGLADDQPLDTEFASTVEIEEGAANHEDTRLAQWRREAMGAKIRYVPYSLPDLLRLPETSAYEQELAYGPSPAARIAQSTNALDYSRRPETDIETCMPIQVVEALARGQGFWSALPQEVRARQLAHMAHLTAELYPTFRLYLFDNRSSFSVPYTVFGRLRVAIYMGEIYVVMTGGDTIRRLTAHFDQLIRQATIASHEAAATLEEFAHEAGRAGHSAA
ncbi:MAG: helix-turn-helix domain-containing protein [Pseudomonadota bacterium]